MTDSRLSTETERPNARADAKLRALVYYFIEQCTGTQAQLGAIRLNKALWLTDVYYYLSTGRQMTESVYVQRKFGPVPKGILGVLYDLEEQDAITIIAPAVFFDVNHFAINKATDAFNGMLSESEKTFAKNVFDAVSRYSWNELSELTQGALLREPPEGEVLDVGEVALRMHPPPFTPEEINEMCDRLVNSGLGFVLVED